MIFYWNRIVLDVRSWAYLIHDDEFDEDEQTLAQT